MKQTAPVSESQAQAMLDVAVVKNEALVKTLKAQRNRESDDAANLSAEVAALKHVVTNMRSELDQERSRHAATKAALDEMKSMNGKLSEELQARQQQKPSKTKATGSKKPAQSE